MTSDRNGTERPFNSLSQQVDFSYRKWVYRICTGEHDIHYDFENNFVCQTSALTPFHISASNNKNIHKPIDVTLVMICTRKGRQIHTIRLNATQNHRFVSFSRLGNGPNANFSSA